MSNKYYKDLLAVFICLVVVIISTLLIGNADSEAKVQFTSDSIILLSGADTTLYALSGSEADSITVSGSSLTADIPNNSSFTIGTSGNKVLKITPSGGSVSLIFDTIYLTSGYVSQWMVSSSGNGVSFLVGVPEANADYLVKANGTQVSYYKSTNAKEVSFSYTGDLTSKAFQVIRQNQPSGPRLPSASFQAPVPPKQGFSVSINNGAEKTTQRQVALTLNGGTDAKRMSISESKDFSDASQEPYATTKTWLLSEGDGLKTVYVKFFTQWGQPTEAVSDSIVLDTLPQQAPQEEPETGKVIIDEPAIIPPATKQQTVKKEQPKVPVKVATPKEITPATSKKIPPKTTTIPAKELIIPKIIVDDTPPVPVEIIEKVADDEITSSVEPKIIPEEQTVSPEKNNNKLVNAEKSILTSFWQAVVGLLRRIWPF